MSEIRNDRVQNAATPVDAGADRLEALAQARRRLQAEKLQAQQSSREAQSQQLQASREAIARALGVNTRLSIERTNTQDVFVYRAIDRETGEVVNEWPPQQFAELIQSVIESGDGAEQVEAPQSGIVVNEEA